jgi:tryptophan synthase alpha chain
MGRIDDAFARRRAENRKALITYLCVGDPDADASVELALACAEAGADVLELGCPFSDPSADGPAIARASQRSLARGGGLLETLRVAEAIRSRSNIPIVLFGYYNPLFVRGDEAASRMASDVGIDALLVVDLRSTNRCRSGKQPRLRGSGSSRSSPRRRASSA